MHPNSGLLLKLASVLPKGDHSRRVLLSEARKAAVAPGEHIQVGDNVLLTTRKGQVPGTVLVARYMRSGKTEIKVSTAVGEFTWNSPDGKYDPRLIAFVGKADAAKTRKLQDEKYEKDQAQDDKKFETAKSGADILHKLDLKIGDLITINYTDVTKQETVMGTNYQTGKVGIKRYKGRPDQDADFWAEINFLLGGRSRRGPREIRWIHAKHIGKIVERFADSYKEDRKGPFTITPRIEAEVENKGWYQINHMNEFIVASEVVALSPAMARKGTDYENPSKDVYRDPVSGYYWRSTGSSD